MALTSGYTFSFVGVSRELASCPAAQAKKNKLIKQLAHRMGVMATPTKYVDAGHYMACVAAKHRRECASLASAIEARYQSAAAQEQQLALAKRLEDKRAFYERKAAINRRFRAAAAADALAAPSASKRAWRRRARGLPKKTKNPYPPRLNKTSRGVGLGCPLFFPPAPALSAETRAENKRLLFGVLRAEVRRIAALAHVSKLRASFRRPVGRLSSPGWRNWLRLRGASYLAHSVAMRTHYRRVMQDFIAHNPLNSLDDFANFRADLAAKLSHNRTMHALNGNIAPYIEGIEDVKDRSREQQMLAEYKSPQTADIANAVVVPTEYLFAANLPEAGNRLGATSFDKNQLDTKFTNDQLKVRDLFLKQAPPNSGAVPSETVEETFFSVCDTRARHPVKLNYLAPPQQKNLGGEMLLQPRYSAIAALFSPDFSVADSVAADSVMANHRFTGTRGARQVQGWEAAAVTRVTELRSMAHLDLKGQSYYRAAFRLWSAYLDASLASNFTVPATQEHPLDAAACIYDGGSPRSHQRVRIIPLSSYAAPGQAGAVTNPEGGLFSPPAGQPVFDVNLDQLEAGRAAFIDGAQLSDESIRLLIWALAPADPHLCWSWDFPAIGGVPASRRASYLSNYAEAPDGSIGGAPRIFVHLGNKQLPTQAAVEHSFLGRAIGGALPVPADPALSAWSRAPSRTLIRNVLMHLIAKHHAGRDVWDALDAVLYRVHQKHTCDILSCPAAAPNLSINAFGNDDYCLPADFTAAAYLDVFRTPTDMSTDANDVMAYLDLRANMFVWQGVFACHASFVSLNWASYTFSLMGREWAVWNRVTKAVAPNTPQYRRNIVTQMLQRLSDIDLNPWAVMHASATGHMYHFRPIDRTISSTHMAMANVWHAAAPFVSNVYVQMWMLKMLPLHMLLPLHGTAPSWPEGEPISSNPSADADHFEVRLARSLPLFTGRAWIQDGGMMANAQHYAAAWARTPRGVRGGDFNARTPGLQIGSWTSPFQYNWPANPAVFRPVYMAPAGSLFGNYLMPGSIWNYTTDNNRVKAVGVKIADDTDPDAAQLAWSRWTRMTTSHEQGTVSIGYIPPPAFKIQREPVNDFSLLIWGNRISAAYEGMSFASTAPRESLPPPPSYAPTAEQRTRLPTHLANHNDPHLPNGPISRALLAQAQADQEAEARHAAQLRAQAAMDQMVDDFNRPSLGVGSEDNAPYARATRYADPFFVPPPSELDRSNPVAFEDWVEPDQSPALSRAEYAAAVQAKRSNERARKDRRKHVSFGTTVNIGTLPSKEPTDQRNPDLAKPVPAHIAGSSRSGVTYSQKNPTDQDAVLKKLAGLANSAAGLGRTGLTPVDLKDQNYLAGLLSKQARLVTPHKDGIVYSKRGPKPKPILKEANDADAAQTQRAIVDEAQATLTRKTALNKTINHGDLLARRILASGEPKDIPLVPAPPLPDSGMGNDHFPGRDVQYFTELGQAIAPEPSEDDVIAGGGGHQSEN